MFYVNYAFDKNEDFIKIIKTTQNTTQNVTSVCELTKIT